MEHTFSKSENNNFLEDLLEQYPQDRRKVSRYLTDIFKVLKSIKNNENYDFLSRLLIDDFTIKNDKRKYSDDRINSLMRNLVVGKRKKELNERIND